MWYFQINSCVGVWVSVSISVLHNANLYIEGKHWQMRWQFWCCCCRCLYNRCIMTTMVVANRNLELWAHEVDGRRKVVIFWGMLCFSIDVWFYSLWFLIELVWLICRVASTIDAVLLSHPDTLHLGALPYAIKHLGLSAPVYSTEPVYRLGLLTMYDHFLSRKVSQISFLCPCSKMYMSFCKMVWLRLETSLSFFCSKCRSLICSL